jgi:hypothetical protein
MSVASPVSETGSPTASAWGGCHKLPDPEKKGIMCTECKKVYWNAASVKKCRCGDIDPDHRINVSSADFNKYTGRFLRDDELDRWLTNKR